MKLGSKVGWLGVGFGFLVGPFQLLRIIITHETIGISLHTYIFLVLALSCYLFEAVRIRSKVFIAAQSINLITNTAILIYLLI